MTVKVFAIAHLPAELRQAWFQHLRDFDVAHPGCHFEIAADAPDLTVAEMARELQVNPGLTFAALFERLEPPDLTTVWTLVHEAAQAGDAVDRFDLRSEDPASRATWTGLVAAQAAALSRLADYFRARA